MSGQQWVATILLAEVFIGSIAHGVMEPDDVAEFLVDLGAFHLVLLAAGVVVGLIAIATGEWVIG